MTAPPPPAPPPATQQDILTRILRPRIILSVLAVVFVVAVLIVPEGASNTFDYRLTTNSAGPSAAKGLYETLGRLGWRTTRRLTPFAPELDSNAVYAVLGGPVDHPEADVSRAVSAPERCRARAHHAR